MVQLHVTIYHLTMIVFQQDFTFTLVLNIMLHPNHIQVTQQPLFLRLTIYLLSRYAVKVGYWEMFDDSCWKNLMLIPVITNCMDLMKDQEVISHSYASCIESYSARCRNKCIIRCLYEIRIIQDTIYKIFISDIHTKYTHSIR